MHPRQIRRRIWTPRERGVGAQIKRLSHIQLAQQVCKRPEGQRVHIKIAIAYEDKHEKLSKGNLHLSSQAT